MQKNIRALAVRVLLLTTIALPIAGFAQGPGLSRGPMKPGLHPKKTITDAAGRVHQRPTARITDAQRKAAARRRQALRAKSSQFVNKAEVKR